jgi:hypothetical protein
MSKTQSTSILHRLGGKTELMLFAIGGGLVYVVTVLAVTIGLGESLPPLGWVGFAVASLLVLLASTALGLFLVRASGAAGTEAPVRRAPRTADMHRVLVVADEGCSGAALCEPIAERLSGRPSEARVVAPATVSATHYLDSDVDSARAAARARLEQTVAAFGSRGIAARGEVGSESPLEAIADALAVFGADEIVIATPPPEQTNWLEEGVVERASELYEIPVSHVVVTTPSPVG